VTGEITVLADDVRNFTGGKHETDQVGNAVDFFREMLGSNLLLLFMEIITVYSGGQTKPINLLCRQNADLLNG
jgi:hypothetical protein